MCGYTSDSFRGSDFGLASSQYATEVLGNTIARLQAVGRESLVSSVTNIMLSEDDLVSVYYINNKTEFEDFIDLVEQILNGQYADLLLSQTKKTEYLFSQALISMGEEISFEIPKMSFSLDAISAFVDGREAEFDLYCEGLADYGIHAADFSPLTGDSFKMIFDNFSKGEIRLAEADQQLTELLGENYSYIKGDVLHSMLEYYDFSKFLKKYKDLADAAKILEKAGDGLRQLRFLNAIDDSRLRIVAGIYKASEDNTVRAVGEKLETLANASDAERILMIYADEFAGFGLSKLINKAIGKAVGGNATLTIANLVVNGFTDVDKLAGLKNKMEWSVSAVHTAYSAFITVRDRYNTSGTDADLIAAYNALTVYYGTAAQAEDSLYQLYNTIKESFVGGLAISEAHKTMLEQVEGVVNSFRRSSAIAAANYSYWQTGDYIAWSRNLDEINERYPAN